ADWNAAFNSTWDTTAEDLDPLWRNKQWREAVPVLDQMRQLDDSYAMLHYMRGQALWELGRFPEAKVSFGRARDEDVCPLRSPQEVLTAVHETAVRRAAPELDFVKLIEGKSLNGVPGDDWFLDHVHPTIEGHRILALAALDEMERQGVLHRSTAWNATAQEEIRRRVESSITAEEQAGALCTVAKVLAWAGKDREAYELALRAVPLAPRDAAIQFEAGKEALKVG